jgi:hypothetical protein
MPFSLKFSDPSEPHLVIKFVSTDRAVNLDRNRGD